MPSSSAQALPWLLLTMYFGTSFFKCVCHFTLFVHFVSLYIFFLFGICVLSSASISIYTVSASPLLCAANFCDKTFSGRCIFGIVSLVLWKFSCYFFPFIIMYLRCRFFYLFWPFCSLFFYRRHTNIDAP